MISPAPLFFLVDASESKRAGYEKLDIDRDWPAFVHGPVCWIVQTCLILRGQGVDAHLSSVPRESGINIAHADTLTADMDPACFTIGVLADRARFVSNPKLVIVQNQTQARPSEGRYWMPHWPQPGLIPRDRTRAAPRVAAYVGRFLNLGMPPLHFAECCRECGWEPRLPGLDHGADLSQVDALVGIRSLDTRTHDRKPASKLVNAWLAGIPFIGGYDSAFAQVGTPGEDYLRVGNLEELKDALIRLREDAELYARLVQAGRQRATAHDRAAVTTAWLKFLNETAYPAFAWREESSFPA